jgi:hypothetical protein
VIPLVLPGIEPSALPLWFDEEPIDIPSQFGPGGLSTALIDILSALGECLPIDSQKVTTPSSKPIEKLLLELTNPKIEVIDEKNRTKVTAVGGHQQFCRYQARQHGRDFPRFNAAEKLACSRKMLWMSL